MRFIPDQKAQRAAAQRVAGVEVQLMGALEAAEVLVLAAEHVGRRRQQLEVLGASARTPGPHTRRAKARSA